MAGTILTTAQKAGRVGYPGFLDEEMEADSA